jgi:hypothetical protein
MFPVNATQIFGIRFIQRSDDTDDQILYELTAEQELTADHKTEILTMFEAISMIDYYRFYAYMECKTDQLSECYFMAWVPLTLEALYSYLHAK